MFKLLLPKKIASRRKKHFRIRIFSLGISIFIFCSQSTKAIPYGSSDARSQAMGGAGVASAENPNAAQQNPALLAGYSQRKHLGNNQRIIFPAFSATISNNILDIVDIDDSDYENQLTQVVDDFNNGQGADAVLNVLNPLNDDLNSVSNDPIYADVQSGVIISIPDRREGGALQLNRRIVLDGNVDYSIVDEDLVMAYLEELTFISNGGAAQILHPELYQNGELLDPSDRFSSRFTATALEFSEMAISMAWQVELFDTEMMIGFTPKWVSVTSYEYSATATSSDITERGKLDNGENFNFDLGWAHRIDDSLTIGFAIKNMVPKEYETESGIFLKIKPQARIGSEYQSSFGAFTLDLDLTRNKPLSGGDSSQEIGLGAEWRLGRHRLRAGLHKNIAGSGDNGNIAYSLGIRLRAFGLFTDMSVGSHNNQQSAAIQFGIRF